MESYYYYCCCCCERFMKIKFVFTKWRMDCVREWRITRTTFMTFCVPSLLGAASLRQTEKWTNKKQTASAETGDSIKNCKWNWSQRINVIQEDGLTKKTCVCSQKEDLIINGRTNLTSKTLDVLRRTHPLRRKKIGSIEVETSPFSMAVLSGHLYTVNKSAPFHMHSVADLQSRGDQVSP